jgi:hypothetical protein
VDSRAAATGLAALGPTFQLRWVMMSLCVLWLRTCGKSLERHVSCGSKSCLSTERAPDCHVSYGLIWVMGHRHKKSLAGLPVRLGPRVSNARAYISKTTDVGDIMSMYDI